MSEESLKGMDDLHAQNEAKAERYDELLVRLEVAERYYQARQRKKLTVNLALDDSERFEAMADERQCWMNWRKVMEG